MATYNDYMKTKTVDAQVRKMYGDNPIHNEHIDEFRQMAAAMIDQALKDHDEQIQIDIQTSLNGSPVSMSGLVADLRKQIVSKLRNAFR